MSTEIQVDDETRAALLLFNERVEAAAAEERGAKRLAKAERTKDEAAATVRKLADNTNASAEEKAAAEAAYKEALESFNTIKENPLAGDTPRKPIASAEDAPTEASADDAPAQEAPAEDAPAETSADDAPAQEAPAEDAPAETSADEELAPAASAESAAAEEPDESE